MKPIFFAWTRSFWLTVVSLVFVIFGAPSEVLYGIATIVSPITPWQPDVIGEVLNTIAPAITFVLAIQQRSGAARPYTVDPRAID